MSGDGAEIPSLMPPARHIPVAPCRVTIRSAAHRQCRGTPRHGTRHRAAPYPCETLPARRNKQILRNNKNNKHNDNNNNEHSNSNNANTAPASASSGGSAGRSPRCRPRRWAPSLRGRKTA